MPRHPGAVDNRPVPWETDYRDHLLSLGREDKTVIEYVRKLRRVDAWCAENGCSLDTLTATEVIAVAATFAQSLATLGQLRAALKHYWEMTGRQVNPHRAVRLPKEEEPPPRPLEAEEARALVKASLGWWPEGVAVLSGLYLALRRETIASMRWDGFDQGIEWYRFQTKGRKVLTRPVHPILAAELRSRSTAYVYMFPGQRGRAHITGATINLWINRVAAEAGIGHVQPHRLRHTALTEMNDRTRDLRVTAEFAGHVKITTTKRYTRTTATRLTEAVMALDYLGDSA